MNQKHIQQLFKAACGEPAPIPADSFERTVMRAVRNEPSEPTLLAQLSMLLPRLAAGAALVIVLCVAADVCLANFVQPDLDSGLTQLAEQWLFAAN